MMTTIPLISSKQIFVSDLNSLNTKQDHDIWYCHWSMSYNIVIGICHLILSLEYVLWYCHWSMSYDIVIGVW